MIFYNKKIPSNTTERVTFYKLFLCKKIANILDHKMTSNLFILIIFKKKKIGKNLYDELEFKTE